MIKLPFLKDTTLAAIVRNEEINPAGGIADYCDRILPYVEEAVIIDTGSTDNTYRLLNEAKKDYPPLRVYQEKFKGFAESRNSSLEKVKTKYSLILDADERMPLYSLMALEKILNKKWDFSGICFYCIPVRNEGIARKYSGSLNPRLFKNAPGIRFENHHGLAYEELYNQYGGPFLRGRMILNKNLEFYHFLGKSLEGKEKWYDHLAELNKKQEGQITSPENFEGYEESKEENPQRWSDEMIKRLNSTKKESRLIDILRRSGILFR
jgi:glycosyltransferase involved in cell wall biosynthesis